MKTVRILLIPALFALCCAAFAQGPFATPSGCKAINDLVFARIGTRELHMDIVLPKDAPAKAHPCVVWIHGGGWSKGTYRGNRAAWLAGKGYVAASVEYRLSGEAIFPAQITDCKAAIRFLRAHAKDYGIDPKRIGVWGGSAGGHLVALLGTTGGVKELEGNEGNPKQSSSVQAVCDFFGPTDLTPQPDWLITPPQVSALLGGSPKDKPELARLASPVKFVDRKDPPFLIMHGEQDRLVPITQSEKLYDALKKAGVDATFVRVKNAGHGFVGADIKPTAQEIDAMVLAFFDKKLKE
jgi:acetyl esterase/lipase